MELCLGWCIGSSGDRGGYIGAVVRTFDWKEKIVVITQSNRVNDAIVLHTEVELAEFGPFI